MKKFQFRLEALLKFREFEEQRARQDVADARYEILQCEERIRRMREDYTASESALEAEISDGISAERYRIYSSFIDDLENRIEAGERERKMLLGTLFDRQKKLKEKSIRKKIMERLRERKKAAWLEETNRMIQKDADDIASLRKARENIG